MKIRTLGLKALAGAALLLAAASAPATGKPPALYVRPVSAPAQWVSGDRVLIEMGAVVKPGMPENLGMANYEVKLNGKTVLEGLSFPDFLVEGLRPGENQIEFIGTDNFTGETSRAVTTVRNFGAGPIFSGKRTEPFICQTEAFKLPDGSTLGKAGPDCSAPTKVQFVYKPKGGDKLVYLADPSRPPADIDQTTNMDGRKVPFLVRVETGTVNRAIYQFAVLWSPVDGRMSGGWNRRLLAVHGTGCARGWYIQGAAMGVSPLADIQRLGEGFAVFTSTLNHPTNSCNAVLAAEMTLMVRQKVIETMGKPLYTLSMGGSGGAYTSLQIADAYPGIIDGVLTNSTFPDALAIATQGLDGHLLNRYFRELNKGFTPAQIQAVGGYGSPSGLRGNGNQAGRTDPISNRTDEPGYASGVWNDAVPPKLRYDPRINVGGARATVFDVAANVYGRDPKTGFGLRPYDNVGVQYGLKALNSRVITPAQFIDLNRRIGGYDNDANYMPARSVGNPDAIRNAYRSGLMLSGAGGLKSIPVVDYSGIYSDLAPRGDYHMKHHHFEVRERLKRWGSGANMVMWSGPNRGGGRGGDDSDSGSAADGLAAARMSSSAFALLNEWMTAAARDNRPGTQAQKVVRNRPARMTDGCWKGEAAGPRFITERQVGTGITACNKLYPPHSQPRIVAGGPTAGDILKCTLKPLNRADYRVKFSDRQWKELSAVFSSGVCDWSKLGQGQQAVRPWSVW